MYFLSCVEIKTKEEEECNPPPQNKTAVKQTPRERETLPCAIA